MKTKDKILHQARVMFNERGITNTSGRDISDALGISYGNLTYHFPKKDDIIRELYLEMQHKLDKQFQTIDNQIMALAFENDSLRRVFEIMHEYKFLYLGLAKVTRHFNEIKAHSMSQYEKRRKMMRKTIDFLLEKGYLKPEKFPTQYDLVIHNLLIISNFWIADSEIFYQGNLGEKVEHYLTMFYTVYVPMFTKEGREIFSKKVGVKV